MMCVINFRFKCLLQKLTFMTVETIKGCVVTVTGVGSIALNTLAAVSTWYGSIETLSSTVPPYTLLFIYFPL